ncbi:zinc finger CCCH domain-containing protein [Trifolium repens]|nr:zinc finger CCCH domain-containing protein [Trifolium repens]
MSTVSTPPMSPLAGSSSPKSGNLWQNKINLTPPSLQLPGSRLKSALSARDMDLEMELLGLDSPRRQQQQQLQQQQMIKEIARISSPSFRNNEFNRIADLNPTNPDDLLAYADPNLLSQLHELSMQPSTPTQQMQSPCAMQMRQNMNMSQNMNMNHLRASYPSNNIPSSPVRKPSAYGFGSSAVVAAAVMNSRSSAFAKQRSQSFIDRGAANHHHGLSLPSNPSSRINNAATPTPSQHVEPDVSWVNSLVKDVSSENSNIYGAENMRQQYDLSREMLPSWVEQMYKEQEQMVA